MAYLFLFKTPAFVVSIGHAHGGHDRRGIHKCRTVAYRWQKQHHRRQQAEPEKLHPEQTFAVSMLAAEHLVESQPHARQNTLSPSISIDDLEENVKTQEQAGNLGQQFFGFIAEQLAAGDGFHERGAEHGEGRAGSDGRGDEQKKRPRPDEKAFAEHEGPVLNFLKILY